MNSKKSVKKFKISAHAYNRPTSLCQQESGEESNVEVPSPRVNESIRRVAHGHRPSGLSINPEKSSRAKKVTRARSPSPFKMTNPKVRKLSNHKKSSVSAKAPRHRLNSSTSADSEVRGLAAVQRKRQLGLQALGRSSLSRWPAMTDLSETDDRRSNQTAGSSTSNSSVSSTTESGLQRSRRSRSGSISSSATSLGSRQSASRKRKAFRSPAPQKSKQSKATTKSKPSTYEMRVVFDVGGRELPLAFDVEAVELDKSRGPVSIKLISLDGQQLFASSSVTLNRQSISLSRLNRSARGLAANRVR